MATVDEAGKIHVAGAGTTLIAITASKEGYKDARAIVELTVREKVLDVTTESKDMVIAGAGLTVEEQKTVNMQAKKQYREILTEKTLVCLKLLGSTPEGEPAQLSGQATLTLAYPEGITYANHEEYDIVLIDLSKESTQTLTFVENGIQATVDSLGQLILGYSKKENVNTEGSTEGSTEAVAPPVAETDSPVQDNEGNTNSTLWIAIAAVCVICAGGAAVIVSKKKKKSN